MLRFPEVEAELTGQTVAAICRCASLTACVARLAGVADLDRGSQWTSLLAHGVGHIELHPLFA